MASYLFYQREKEFMPGNWMLHKLTQLAVMKAVLTDLLCCLIDKSTARFIIVAHTHQPSLHLMTVTAIYIANLSRGHNYSSFRRHKICKGSVLYTINQFICLSLK